MAALGSGKVWAAMGQPRPPVSLSGQGSHAKQSQLLTYFNIKVITFMWLHIVSIGCVSVPDVLLSAFQDWFLPRSLQLSELGICIVPFSKQELRFKQCVQCQDHWAGQWLRWDLTLGCYFQILTPYPLYKHTSWVVIWSQQHGFSEACLLYDLKAGMSGGAHYQSFKASTHAEGSVSCA